MPSWHTLQGLGCSASHYFPWTPTYDPIIRQRFPTFDAAVCYVNRGPLTFHFYASVVFFATIAYMAIFRFPLTKERFITAQKRKRNVIDLVFGGVMAASVVILVIQLARQGSIFWPETVAIGAFGVAWLTKGQLILKDKPSERKNISLDSNRWGLGKGGLREGSHVGSDVVRT